MMPLRYRSTTSLKQQLEQCKLLLQKDYGSLTPADQLAYIKAMVEYYFLDEEKHYIPKEKEFLEWVRTARAAIQEVQEDYAIILILINLANQFKAWDSKLFLHGGTKEVIHERALEIAELANRLYHIDYYAAAKIISHREAYALQPKAKETYQQFEHGLPPELIKAILAHVRFGISIVDGGRGNKWNHAILSIAEDGMFHIDRQFHDFPKYLTGAQRNVYLKNNNKELLSIHHIPLPDVNGAIVTLDMLVRRKWRWLGPVNNCMTFCYEVLAGGGYKAKTGEEYQASLFDIPSQHRKNAVYKELVDYSSMPISERLFSERDLRTENISEIKVSEGYKPEEAIKFLMFVTTNFDEVVEWQKSIIVTERQNQANFPKPALEGVGLFSQATQGSDKADTIMAIERICNKLLAILDAIVGKYKILFQEGIIGKDLKNKLDKLAQTVRTIITENCDDPYKLILAFIQNNLLAETAADTKCCNATMEHTILTTS